jgi:hypothetical protein
VRSPLNDTRAVSERSWQVTVNSASNERPRDSDFPRNLVVRIRAMRALQSLRSPLRVWCLLLVSHRLGHAPRSCPILPTPLIIRVPKLHFSDILTALLWSERIKTEPSSLVVDEILFLLGLTMCSQIQRYGRLSTDYTAPHSRRS